MNIGLTLYGSLDGRSGGFRYDRKLVEELRRGGDSVDVVELPWRNYARGLLDNASRDVRERLSADVDVMLQDELAHPSLVYNNRSVPYPVVSIVHHLRASEPGRLQRMYRAIERSYLGTVDAAVCNSTVTRDAVTALGVDREATVVAPPAGDRFAPEIDDATITERAHDGPLRAVCVGNLEPRKGVDTLVEAVSMVAEDVELTVVGRPVDTAYAASVRERVAELSLADRVTLAGELTDAALAETLRSAHVMAVPSRYEGFGIVYLEGMSFGLPAIASRAGGATDIITQGETGLLVDPDAPSAVAHALSTLAADRDRLAELGLTARRRYERHPDWAATAARVRTVLEATVDGPEVTP
jgi:glycosyltransferase involved in cell wall biosynthesis